MFRNGFPSSIGFSQLHVHFNLKEYDSSADTTDPEQLKFSPGEQRVLSFHFTPKNEHVQRPLEVKKKPKDVRRQSFGQLFRSYLFH